MWMVLWAGSNTTGFTGADLANLVNEAALLAGREGKAEVGSAPSVLLCPSGRGRVDGAVGRQQHHRLHRR